MTTYRDQSHDLAVQYDPRGFELSDELKARFEEDLELLATILGRGPSASLHVELIKHQRQGDFHVKTRLGIDRARVFFTGDRDALPGPAFKRCVHKLIRKIERFRAQAEHRHPSAADLAPHVTAIAEPDWARLIESVELGDHAAFRTAMAVYEDALAQRVGRVVNRFPAALAALGQGLLISEIVEEVFLIAFDRFAIGGASHERLGSWLEDLIEPALQALLLDPSTEQENVAFARSLA